PGPEGESTAAHTDTAPFWIPWLIASTGMLREAAVLRRADLPRSAYGRHFSRQVQLGALLLLALVLGSARALPGLS
ncbi:MAG: hypothetical protein ACKOPS_17190, partial [Cyanobium sp.]